MDFLSYEKILYWYNFSLNKSGFKSVEPFVKNFWIKLATKGLCSIPPGFVASLMHRFMPIKIGTFLQNKTPFLEEETYIERICTAPGADKLFNIFMLVDTANKRETLLSIFEQIIYKLPDFKDDNIMFFESELNKAFELNAIKPEEESLEFKFDMENILKDLYQSAENEFIDSKLTFSPEDIFEISHPSLFDKASDRLFYRKMSRSIKLMSFWLRGTFTLTEESSWIVSKYGEPQILPLGGYDELTNKGNISSVLTSEFAYTDETMDFDLFDYKLSENQLLYFKRDSGSIYRIRRDFIIKIPLTEFFEHEKNLGLLFACIFCFADKIIEVYAKDMVNVVVYLSGYAPTSIKEAAGFFDHFLAAKTLSGRIKMIIEKDGSSLSELIRTNAHVCAFSNQHIKDSNYIKFVFPQNESFAQLSQEKQEQKLGKLLNSLIEKAVKNEYDIPENK